jgi:hypothetical protein
MAASTRASGTEILGTAKDLRGIPMATLTSDNLSMVKHMAKESIPGRTERSTMVNGTRGLSKDMAFGKAYRMILT